MSESWDQYGFPDSIVLRNVYTPVVGLIKALNERRSVLGLQDEDIPDYFSSFIMPPINSLRQLEHSILSTFYSFVYPPAVSGAQYYWSCFWGDQSGFTMLEEAGITMEEFFFFEPDVVNYPFNPGFPAQWAINMYKIINLMRYVATTSEDDWPTFHYEDKNNTFQFKAP